MYGDAEGPLVVVADDLTGAADTVVHLATAGGACLVLDPAADWPRGDVLAVDTDSRHAPADVAAQRAGAAAVRAGEAGAEIYKKVDSTLRGNIAAELIAMADALAHHGSRPLVVLAPAFPATGRTTVRGIVHLDGEPSPDLDVVALLDRGGLSACHLTRGGPGPPGGPGAAEGLAASLDRARADGFGAVVVDALMEDDLLALATACALCEAPVLPAGSGGLARAFADRPLSSPAERPTAPATALGGPGLFVVGSRAAQSRAQRRRLAEHGVRPVLLPASDGSDDDVAALLREALLCGPVVLSPDPDAPVVPERAAETARRLAGVAAAALDRAGTLVATGGETARAVLTAAGVSRLDVRYELAPGVVRSRASSLELDVVTKAGAFGDPDALLRCLRHLTPPDRSTS